MSWYTWLWWVTTWKERALIYIVYSKRTIVMITIMHDKWDDDVDRSYEDYEMHDHQKCILHRKPIGIYFRNTVQCKILNTINYY